MTESDPIQPLRSILHEFVAAEQQRLKVEAEALARKSSEHEATSKKLDQRRRDFTGLEASAKVEHERQLETEKVALQKTRQLGVDKYTEAHSVQNEVAAYVSRVGTSISMTPSVGKDLKLNPNESAIDELDQRITTAKDASGKIHTGITNLWRWREKRARRRRFWFTFATIVILITLIGGFFAYVSYSAEQLYTEALVGIEAGRWNQAADSLIQLNFITSPYKDVPELLLQNPELMQAIADRDLGDGERPITVFLSDGDSTTINDIRMSASKREDNVENRPTFEFAITNMRAVSQELVITNSGVKQIDGGISKSDGSTILPGNQTIKYDVQDLENGTHATVSISFGSLIVSCNSRQQDS